MSLLGKLIGAPGLFCLALTDVRADPLDQWIRHDSGFDSPEAVAYGTNKFVAVGENGKIFVSTNNGTTWNAVPSGVSNFLHGIAWGQNLFAAVGDNGTILTSADTLAWTQQSSPATNHLRAVRHLGDKFIAVGSAGTLLTSSNGLSWVARNSGSAMTLDGVAFGNGIFCAVGGGSSANASITRSLDSTNWSNQTVSFNYLYDVTFGNGVFTAQGVRGQVWTSTNGIDWTLRQSGNVGYLFDATFAQGKFVAVGSGGGQKIVSSPDGVNWQIHPVTTGHSGSLLSVAYGNGYFVAVGQKGIVLQSGPVFKLSAGNFLPGGELQFTLTGEAGRNYHFQSSVNLGNTNWTNITNFVSTGETTVLTDSAPDPAAKFYRVISPTTE